jgi:hypothetical protein
MAPTVVHKVLQPAWRQKEVSGLVNLAIYGAEECNFSAIKISPSASPLSLV